MARRATQSPTELVVTYFMTGDLVAVEQALVMASAIVRNRRERETSVALTAPARRRRGRASQPQLIVDAGTAPGQQEQAPPPTPVVGVIQQQAAAQSPRRRTRPVIVPPSGTEAPKRRRRRRAAAGPVASDMVPLPPGASALPTQLAPGDDGYEPISTQE